MHLERVVVLRWQLESGGLGRAFDWQRIVRHVERQEFGRRLTGEARACVSRERVATWMLGWPKRTQAVRGTTLRKFSWKRDGCETVCRGGWRAETVCSGPAARGL